MLPIQKWFIGCLCLLTIAQQFSIGLCYLIGRLPDCSAESKLFLFLISCFLLLLLFDVHWYMQMSSAAGKNPAPGQAVYSASKYALNGYFHSLRSEV